MADAIKVVVRCRPLNAREIARGATELIRMDGNQTILNPPSQDPAKLNANSKNTEKEQKAFTFDRSFWSAGAKDDPGYASQQVLYDYLGIDLLNHAFAGFNTCLFAYGQTGSGKSYSMMGYGLDKGVIPLTCEALFERITELTDSALSFTVQVSFLEIYNERCRDLLNPKNKGNLKVREHPSLGPYVEDLSKLAVSSYRDVESLMDEGNKARTVAATQMNETSSRSHSIFTLLLTQKRKDEMTKMEGEKVSRISLVDLAGSERAVATGATGARLKEGANINRSLTTLGKVIAALAQASSAPAKGKKAKDDFVPYRDSVLTWLLKDSLGGNSKTAMIAAISPADYEETLSTLRYADAAKQIKNKAIVNEDTNTKVIRELKEELLLLRSRLSGSASEATYDPSVPPEKQIVQYQTSSGEIKTVTKAELQEQLEQSEKLMADVNQTWEEKLVQTQAISKEREEALEALGISIEKNLIGVRPPRKMPHIVNLCEDALMAECLLYQIKPGKTMVGNAETSTTADIRLGGEGILDEHCFFESEENGTVHLHALEGGTTMVNGQRLNASQGGRRLKSGYRIIIGDWHVFRFQSPIEVQKTRDRMRSAGLDSVNATPDRISSPRPDGGMFSRPDSPSESATSGAAEDVDWSFARREAVVARLDGSDINLDQLADSDLNTLYRDIRKVRSLRQGTSLGRPDSRMSYMEEEDSSAESRSVRPFSGDTWLTDDTSIDSSLLSGQHGESAIGIQEMKREMEAQLENQKRIYEERLGEAANSAMSVDDVTRHRVDMESQLQTLQAEMQEKLNTQKRHFEARLKRAKSKQPHSDAEVYRDDQVQLLRKVLVQWKTQRKVKIAEEALELAKSLKEANVISKELGKSAIYQFTVLESRLEAAAPLPAQDMLSQLEDDDDPMLEQSQRPCLAVKVLDFRHRHLSVWSIEKFKRQLGAMRALYKFLDKPSHSQHLDWEQPFYGTSNEPAELSYIGRASIYIRPLICGAHTDERVSIWSPFTLSVIGTCRLRVCPKTVSLTSPGSNSTLHHFPHNLTQKKMPDRSILTFSVIVDNLEGLSPDLFAAVSCQIRPPSFLKDGNIVGSEVCPLEADSTSSPACGIYKEYTVEVNPVSRIDIADGLLSVECFAKIRPAFLTHMLECDDAYSVSTRRRANSSTSSNLGRRPEVELIQDQHHDVIMDIAICELDSHGKYSPVPLISNGQSLDPGAFFLRQGIQRRLEISLRHTSGRSWRWTTVDSVIISNVRLLDGKGLVHASQFDRPLSLTAAKSPATEFDANGTCTLTFVAPWDSSAHGADCLNKITTPGNRILLHLACCIKSAESEPAIFEVDVAATIQGRDAKNPSKFLGALTGQRFSTATTSLFSVQLQPTYQTSAEDVWRKDTSGVYVRGEEALGNWRPHGISMIEAFYRNCVQENKMLAKTATKQILESLPPSLLLPSAFGESDNTRLRKALTLWQRRFGSKDEVKLGQEPVNTSSAAIKSNKSARKSKVTVQIVPRTDTYIKQSYLSVLRDPAEGKWSKQWFSLKRPYLFISQSSSSSNFTDVINTAQIRVEASPEMEEMTGRLNVFALYTAQNCYFLQADSIQQRDAWINVSFDAELV